jgi:hypothetical protein
MVNVQSHDDGGDMGWKTWYGFDEGKNPVYLAAGHEFCKKEEEEEGFFFSTLVHLGQSI